MALRNAFGELSLESTQQQVKNAVTSPLQLRGENGSSIASRENPHSIRQIGSKHLFGESAVTTAQTVDLVSVLTTKPTILKTVFCSGSGDAIITVSVNAAPIYRGRLTVVKQNIDLPLNVNVAASATIKVSVTSEATATANFYSTVLYEE